MCPRISAHIVLKIPEQFDGAVCGNADRFAGTEGLIPVGRFISPDASALKQSAVLFRQGGRLAAPGGVHNSMDVIPALIHHHRLLPGAGPALRPEPESAANDMIGEVVVFGPGGDAVMGLDLPGSGPGVEKAGRFIHPSQRESGTEADLRLGRQLRCQPPAVRGEAVSAGGEPQFVAVKTPSAGFGPVGSTAEFQSVGTEKIALVGGNIKTDCPVLLQGEFKLKGDELNLRFGLRRGSPDPGGGIDGIAAADAGVARTGMGGDGNTRCGKRSR